MSGLFGRGLLYVVVWSMQIVSASLISPVLAHLMGPGEFGQLASAIALHQVLIIIAIVGIDQALVLQRAKDQSDATARGLVAVGILIAAIFTALISITGPSWSVLLGFNGYSSLLIATVLWTAPGAAVQLMMALLLSQDRFRPFAVVSGLSAVGGQVFGIALLLRYGREAGVYAWGGVISQFSAMALGLILTRPSVRGLFNWRAAVSAAQVGVPLAISTLFLFVLNAGDRVIIQRMLGAYEVGRYQVAYVVGYVVVMLASLVAQAWTPQIAGVSDLGARCKLIARSRDELYRLLIPVILGVTLAAPLALRIVAPSSFRLETLVVVVFLVAASAFPVVASNASGKVLLTERRTRPVAVSAGVAAALNVLLNIIFLPRYGLNAAALSTVVAFGLRAVLQRKVVSELAAVPRTPRPLIAGSVLTCTVCAISTLLPQSMDWNVGRLILGLACLPWFLKRLRLARRVEVV